MNEEELRKLRFAAGLEESSTLPYKAPLTDEEELLEQVSDALAENSDALVLESEKVDFSEKTAESVANLDNEIEENGGRNVTLSEGKEGIEDLNALGLTQVARVVDLGKLKYKVFEDKNDHLWFLDSSDSGNIKETTMTMDDLRKHNAGNDVKMKETQAERKASASDSEEE